MLDRRDLVLDAWLDQQVRSDLWTTSINVFETRLGLSRLPEGRRRRTLEEAFASVVADLLEGRVAELDAIAAEAAGRLGASRALEGRVVDIRDTLIAGIALSRGAVVATRNVRHFADLATGVVDPWAGGRN